MSGFANLGLKKEIVERIKHKEPLDIQKKVIPEILSGKNVVFQSKTGSGKTLAFSAPFLSKINPKQGLQMIVIVPTRELCMQVGKEIKTLTDLNIGIMYGGRAIEKDYKLVNKKNQIIVATPGRFISHVNVKKIHIGEVKFLIYDEADEMFDKGFYDDCAYIKRRVSKSVQVVLSSATITENVKNFIRDFIGEHSDIRVGEQVSERIEQEKISVEIPDKMAMLKKVLAGRKWKRVLIFCNAKDRLYKVVMALEKKYKVRSISSDLEQNQRESFLDLFMKGRINILVATDLAARGLHIENVDMVINFDVPNNSKFYIHRIGRSGRLDKKGYAITFVCKEDIEKMENIEFEFIHDFKIKEISY